MMSTPACIVNIARWIAVGILSGVCWIGIVSLSGCQRRSPQALQTTIPENAVERVAEKGPVKLAMHVWPSVPRLSDLVSMEIEIQFDEGVEVKPPGFGQAVGEFLVRDYSELRSDPLATPSEVGREKQTRRFHYQLEPTRAGKHLIRAIAVEFVDKREGSENYNTPTLLESDPIEINVTSELGDAVPNLASLEPMFPPQPLDDGISWWWALAAVPIVALLGLLVWKRRRGRSNAPEVKTLTPAEIARAALAQLLSENLPAQGRLQEFYLRLTGVVRQFIEGTTGVRAPEQTTEEFLRAMHNQRLFSAEQSVRLQDFLEAADMVKYAGQKPSSEQIELSIARATEFVELRPIEKEKLATSM